MLGFAIVAFSGPASAQSDLALATIVAPNAGNSTTTDLSTIVMTGTDLPIAPDADMGKEEDTDFVSVNDPTTGWIAGFGTGRGFHASCYVTIGASTSTQLILSVGNQGAFCLDDFVHPGDVITVALVDGGGNTLGSASATAVANPTAGTGAVTVPVVSGVTPATGPAAGGTADALARDRHPGRVQRGAAGVRLRQNDPAEFRRVGVLSRLDVRDERPGLNGRDHGLRRRVLLHRQLQRQYVVVLRSSTQLVGGPGQQERSRELELRCGQLVRDVDRTVGRRLPRRRAADG